MITDSAQIYSKLEKIDVDNMFGEEEWDNSYAGAELSVLIAKANSCFDLSDYLNTKFQFIQLNSSSGWIKKTYCPFHKNGHERTPSFFVNPIKNTFHCLACGIHGGFVEYIALSNECSIQMAVTHVLNVYSEISSNTSLSEEKKKISEKKKTTESMLELSDLFREFISSHKDDKKAMEYIFKAMEGFDSLVSINKEKVEEKIEEIAINLRTFVKLYDKQEKTL